MLDAESRLPAMSPTTTRYQENHRIPASRYLPACMQADRGPGLGSCYLLRLRPRGQLLRRGTIAARRGREHHPTMALGKRASILMLSCCDGATGLIVPRRTVRYATKTEGLSSAAASVRRSTTSLARGSKGTSSDSRCRGWVVIGKRTVVVHLLIVRIGQAQSPGFNNSR